MLYGDISARLGGGTITSFESTTPLADWNEPVGSEFSVTTTRATDGSNGLEGAWTSSGSSVIATTDHAGLPVQAGDTFAVDFYHGSTANEDVRIMFGCQSESTPRDNTYSIGLVPGSSEWYMDVWENGSFTTVWSDTSNASFPHDAWVTLEVQWGSSGDFTVTMYDQTDTQLEQQTGTDTTWSSGGIGHWGPSASFTSHFDFWRYL